MMRLDTLHDLFAEGLADMRSVEQQLVEALPRMAAAAQSDELRSAIEEHLEQTRGHLQRVEDVIATCGFTVQERTSEAMQGLLREGERILSADGNPIVKDAAIIAAAQKVEHYEIAAYGTLAQHADHLDLEDAKDTLGQTLDEEELADKLLTKIATGGLLRAGVNERAPQ
jgi:ferritin-like metal-binding protein YciE